LFCLLLFFQLIETQVCPIIHEYAGWFNSFDEASVSIRLTEPGNACRAYQVCFHPGEKAPFLYRKKQKENRAAAVGIPV